MAANTPDDDLTSILYHWFSARKVKNWWTRWATPLFWRWADVKVLRLAAPVLALALLAGCQQPAVESPSPSQPGRLPRPLLSSDNSLGCPE